MFVHYKENVSNKSDITVRLYLFKIITNNLTGIIKVMSEGVFCGDLVF